MALYPNSLAKSFPEIRNGAPYSTQVAGESNGFAHVRDKNGNEIATCYGNGPIDALMIATALNFFVASARLSELDAGPKEAA